VTNLQGQGVRGLVLDLRGNAGGRLDVGTQLLGRFVSDGVVYQMVDRQGRGRTERLRGASPIVTVPLAVLVDEATASMGELFAATIQERAAGRIIGATTAGSVSASVVVPLSDGSALQMTVERLLTGNGRVLDKVGVTPDEPVPLSIADIQAGRDPQLDAALAYLRQAANPYAPDLRAAAVR
jgi:carboxyl-terminal processing protease